jgi:transcriptional regulator with XRE-family HTH domain
MTETLGSTLRKARNDRGLSLRDVERQTGIHNAHLSQIESGTIARPELAILWELAALYDIEYADLLELAGDSRAQGSSGRQRQRLSIAMRAMGELTPKQQDDVISYMAALRRKRDRG